MHNLLWKFVALAGVAGIGFMVVLQVMDSMEVDPNLGPQQAVADTQSTPETPADQAERKPLPPLRTKETVALADPFTSQASQAVPSPPTANPFETNEFPPLPGKSQPVPEPVEPESATNAFPSFPALPAPQPEKSAASDAPESELPELPLLIPMTNEQETPNLEAFSQAEPPKASTAPPALPPKAEPTPQDDPFSDPPLPQVKPDEKKPNENEPILVPFDPYEPLPESEPKKAEVPAEEEAPVLFPPSEPAASKPAETFTPEFPAPAFPESPEAAGTEAAAPSLTFPTQTAEAAATESLPKQEPTKAGTTGNQPTLAEPSFDPLDQNPFPAETPETAGATKPRPMPGRATVQIPPGSTGDEKPLFPPVAEEIPEPKVSEKKTQESPAPSLAPPTMVESTPRVKPLPDLTMPMIEGPETALPGQPECAVPAAAVSEAPPTPEKAASEPESFIDPLDQFPFPSVPETATAQPEQVPLNAVAPPTQPGPGPSPVPVQTQSEPKVSDAAAPTPGTSGTPQFGSTGIEGVGVLGGSVPSGPQQPELKIEKTAPPKAALGQPMIYNILVRNVGASAAHEVIVEDQIPKGTQLTGTIPRGEMADNRLIWRLGVIKPGEEKKIAVRVIPTQEGQIGSVAKVSFVAEVAARTVVAASKLALEFTGPSQAVVGDPVTFHFKLSNLGTGDASKVYLRNLLPEGLNHPDGNDLEYEVGLLKAGEVKEIDLTVNATKAGEFANKAVITAASGAQKEAIAKIQILGDRITITRTGPKRRYVGRTASFSNTIANLSDAKIAPVHVVEVIPAGMDFVEASAGGKFDPQKRTVTWSIPELAPNGNRLLKLDLLAREEGPQTSEVIAYDPNGTRAVVKSETTIEGYTALRLDVREYAEPVDVGEEVGLRVVATNKGTKPTTKIIVKMTIPEEMEFVSAKGPVDFKRDGATLTFNPVASLDAGQELNFDLVLKSQKPGDSRVKLEIVSEQMEKPLSRQEAIRILPTRP